MTKLVCYSVSLLCVIAILGLGVISIIHVRRNAAERTGKAVVMKALIVIFIPVWLSTSFYVFLNDYRKALDVIEIIILTLITAIMMLFISFLLYKLVELIVLTSLRSKIFKAIKNDKTKNDIIEHQDEMICQLKYAPMLQGAIIVDLFYIVSVLCVAFENSLGKYEDYITTSTFMILILFIYMASKHIDVSIQQSLKKFKG